MHITVSPDRARLPATNAQSIMTTRMKMGDSQVILRYRQLPALVMPVLDVEFYDDQTKRYSLRYHLPPDTPERTSRRVSLLLYLIDRKRR